MKKVVIKLLDRTLLLGTVMERTEKTINIKNPITVSVQMSPEGRPTPALVPLDIIFDDVKEDKNNVIIKENQIMWEKDMEDFPTYESNYDAAFTEIVQTSKPGIIT